MKNDLSPNWNLEVIFPGGSESPEFAHYLELLAKDIEGLHRDLLSPIVGVEKWVEVIGRTQKIANKQRQAGAFISCLTAQNVKDEKARVLGNKTRQLNAAYSSVLTQLDKYILETSDLDWNELLKQDTLAPLTFNLNERRRRAKDKMSAELETLVNDLSVEGYHGWSALYDTITGRMTIPIEENGKTVHLSTGQAANRLQSPDRAVREHVMQRWEEAWAKEADLCTLALNSLAGYRLSLYRHRGWDDVLFEPSDYNRMSQDTLHTMWSSITANKGRLVEFLNRKKKMLNIESLNWHDVSAPIGEVGGTVSFSEAAKFIVNQFAKISPKMADFTKKVFENGWVEAEDRPGKRAGAFCTSFPEIEQSRVFMTFAGTMGNVTTLAHELGHAYHQGVMNDVPPMAQQYAMNVAETASTFAEMLVADAALQGAKNA
ncbi:MAG: M3 family metallopeptidase, partial [bacterium]|nr:M3 family metallopeptidase [bacterium]